MKITKKMMKMAESAIFNGRLWDKWSDNHRLNKGLARFLARKMAFRNARKIDTLHKAGHQFIKVEFSGVTNPMSFRSPLQQERTRDVLWNDIANCRVYLMKPANKVGEEDYLHAAAYRRQFS